MRKPFALACLTVLILAGAAFALPLTAPPPPFVSDQPPTTLLLLCGAPAVFELTRMPFVSASAKPDSFAPPSGLGNAGLQRTALVLSVPEPAALTLLALGLGGMFWLTRRKRHR